MHRISRECQIVCSGFAFVRFARFCWGHAMRWFGWLLYHYSHLCSGFIMFAKVMNWPLISKWPRACALYQLVFACFCTRFKVLIRMKYVLLTDPLFVIFINLLEFWGRVFAHISCAADDCAGLGTRTQITVNVLVLAFNPIIFVYIYLPHSKRHFNELTAEHITHFNRRLAINKIWIFVSFPAVAVMIIRYACKSVAKIWNGCSWLPLPSPPQSCAEDPEMFPRTFFSSKMRLYHQNLWFGGPEIHFAPGLTLKKIVHCYNV